MSNHNDFEGGEPVPGLPARLPAGEDMLWQGAPSWRALMRDALHANKVALYFAALGTWKLASGLADGKTAAEVAFSVGITLLLGVVALGIIAGIAALMARTTLYTVTNKRIVMRFGIALPITFQFPFTQITSADVRRLSGDAGTLVFSLKEHTKISWAILWPHVRGWKVAKPQPALRAVADIDAVSDILRRNLAAAHGISPVVATGTPQVAPTTPGLVAAE
ncbi:MAG: photosynthetic complex putative assembly protein PuhB [Pseudomonadota bacterium]